MSDSLISVKAAAEVLARLRFTPVSLQPVNPDIPYILMLRNDKKAEQTVRQHHENVFVGKYGAIETDYENRGNAAGKLHVELGKAVGVLQGQLALCNAAHTARWTWPERLQVGVLLSVAALLVGIGINALAGFLIASGRVPLFTEQPILAYLSSSIPLAIPFVLERVHCGLTGSLRSIFLHSLNASSLASAGTWLWAFSSVNKRVEPGEIIRQVLDGNSGVPAASFGAESALIISQLSAEFLCSAVLGIAISSAFERHRPPPERGRIEESLREYTAQHSECAQLVSLVDGELKRIDALRKTLIDMALAFLRRPSNDDNQNT